MWIFLGIIVVLVLWFVDAIITSPSSSYSYAVGAAGSAGSAGTSGAAGGAGGAGYIEVTEYYQ
jgi:hypothetical protein